MFMGFFGGEGGISDRSRDGHQPWSASDTLRPWQVYCLVLVWAFYLPRP